MSDRAEDGEEIVPQVCDEIQRRLGVMRRCQDAVDRGRSLDEAAGTPGVSEWFAAFAFRDESAAAAGWLMRMSMEADRLGLGAAFRSVVQSVPRAVLSLELSEAARVQGGMLS